MTIRTGAAASAGTAARVWDAKSARAGEILSAHLRKLGWHYKSSLGPNGRDLSIESGGAIVRDGQIEVGIRALASHEYTSEASVKRDTMRLLKPLFEDSFRQMEAELGRHYPLNVQIDVTQTRPVYDRVTGPH